MRSWYLSAWLTHKISVNRCFYVLDNFVACSEHSRGLCNYNGEIYEERVDKHNVER